MPANVTRLNEPSLFVLVFCVDSALYFVLRMQSVFHSEIFVVGLLCTRLMLDVVFCANCVSVCPVLAISQTYSLDFQNTTKSNLECSPLKTTKLSLA